MGAGQPGTHREARIAVWAANGDIGRGPSVSATMRGVSETVLMGICPSLTRARGAQLRRTSVYDPGILRGCRTKTDAATDRPHMCTGWLRHRMRSSTLSERT